MNPWELLNSFGNMGASVKLETFLCKEQQQQKMQ